MEISCSDLELGINWHELVDNLPTALLFVSSKGTVIFANKQAEELLSTPLLGENWSDIINRSFQPREDDGLQVSLKDGRKIQVDLKSLPKGLGQLILLSDLTPFREFENQREKQERFAEMGRMIAEIAHQIRTPLSAATLYSQNLRKEPLPQFKKENFLDKLKLCLDAIEVQIRDLLVFAKGGESLLACSTVNDFMKDIQNQMSALLLKENAKLKLKTNCGGRLFIAHLETLKGALCNVIDNAILSNSSIIEFSVSIDQHNKIVFGVSDNGEGMSEEVIKRVIKPFYTTRAKGTGLGLAVVDSVCKAHAGYLEIKSTIGIGSKITLHIPYMQGSKNE